MVARTRRCWTAAAGAAILMLPLAGCGSGDSDDTSAADTSSTAASAEGGPVPEDLLGTYEVTLKPSDLPSNPPPELTDGPPEWIVTIAKSGGVGGGSSLGIANKEFGSLEDSNFVVDGDSIVLKNEECASPSGSGYDFYDNEYSFKLQGDSLSFTTVDNSCPDQVAETILTSRPLTRTK